MCKVRFATSRDMGLQEVEVFRPCWPMSDGFRASRWMAAQGRKRRSRRSLQTPQAKALLATRTVLLLQKILR